MWCVCVCVCLSQAAEESGDSLSFDGDAEVDGMEEQGPMTF